jgi:hypothetical protein
MRNFSGNAASPKKSATNMSLLLAALITRFKVFGGLEVA